MFTTDRRNFLAVCFSQFGSAFSFNFILVFIPFYVTSISGYSESETLLWIGAIMGSTGTILSFTAPVWGASAHRFRPKRLFLGGLALHTTMFFLMAFTRDLRFLLVLRMLQGCFGGVSTIALIIVTSTSLENRRTTDLGIFQSSMTLGQLIGPPLGSLAVAALGYTGAFLSASVVLFASFVFCLLFVNDVPRLAKAKATATEGKTRFDKVIAAGFLLCLVSQIQLMFLPSILPNVLGSFSMRGATAVRWAGILVMLYTVTAMIGNYVWCAIGQRIGIPRMITVLLVLGLVLQALMALPTGFIGFTALRMAQTGMIAAIVPLTLSMFTVQPKGSVIGFLNSARFVGNAMGPFMATSVLAFSGLPFLYLSISGISLLALVAYRISLRS
jgi:MFS transporter, DHA1 family, multidrug resistance protein